MPISSQAPDLVRPGPELVCFLRMARNARSTAAGISQRKTATCRCRLVTRIPRRGRLDRRYWGTAITPKGLGVNKLERRSIADALVWPGRLACAFESGGCRPCRGQKSGKRRIADLPGLSAQAMCSGGAGTDKLNDRSLKKTPLDALAVQIRILKQQHKENPGLLRAEIVTKYRPHLGKAHRTSRHEVIILRPCPAAGDS